jgi:hypothetical protein
MCATLWVQLPDQEVCEVETTTMTLAEAREYLEHAYESEGEQRAEYGSGAVSLGYDGNEAMFYYDGYRTAEDPHVACAEAVLKEASVVRVIQVGFTDWRRMTPGALRLPSQLAAEDAIPF